MEALECSGRVGVPPPPPSGSRRAAGSSAASIQRAGCAPARPRRSCAAPCPAPVTSAIAHVEILAVGGGRAHQRPHPGPQRDRGGSPDSDREQRA